MPNSLAMHSFCFQSGSGHGVIIFPSWMVLILAVYLFMSIDLTFTFVTRLGHYESLPERTRVWGLELVGT